MTVPYHVEIRPKENRVLFLEDNTGFQFAEYPMYLVNMADDEEPSVSISALLQIEMMEMSDTDFKLTGVYTVDITPKV